MSYAKVLEIRKRKTVTKKKYILFLTVYFVLELRIRFKTS